MTSDQQIPDPQHAESSRPLGFWLKLVDRRLSDEIEHVLDADDLTRREWRMLNLLAGEARDEHLAAKLAAKPGLVHRLVERSWVEGTPPALTPAGRDALDRLTEQVGQVRSRVAGAVSAEDYATTVATLEAIARELGWDESQPLPRGHRGGRGFARRHAGFGWPGRADRGFGRAGFDPRQHAEHHGHGPREYWPHEHDPREHGEHGEYREHREHRDHHEHDPREHAGHRDHHTHGSHGSHGSHGEHHGRAERHEHRDDREHGSHHGFGPYSRGARFGGPSHEPRDRFAHEPHRHGDKFGGERCAPPTEFDARERGRFGRQGRSGGAGRPRPDVHVHVHLHGERHTRNHPRRGV